MPRNHCRISTPKNIYESIGRSIGLRSKLVEFQKMAYVLQLEEKYIDYNYPQIQLYVDKPTPYNIMKNEFEVLVGYLLDAKPKIYFEKGQIIESGFVKPFELRDFEYLSLFSGGLDSSAMPFLPQYTSKKGILHHTVTNTRILSDARKVFEKYFKVTRRQTLVTTDSKSKVEDPAYLKTRGLIFLTNALCIASELDIREVIVPENGPFMLNIPVSASVDPTRTTDPPMIEQWSQLFNSVTKSNVKVSMPFRNMTKSEVILLSGKGELIKDTWSCSYTQGLKHMCGMCNSCLIRILSCYAIEEGEDLESCYKDNPFTVVPATLGLNNQQNHKISKDTASFCRSVLDQSNLNEIEKERICGLKKLHPVLENHALDMMLGFMELKKRHTLTGPLFAHFTKMLHYIETELLDKRRERLMKKKVEIGWS